MMYRKGEAKIMYPGKSEWGDTNRLYDGSRTVELPEAYLPHSCDEWVIGGLDQISQMIDDLKDLRIELLAYKTGGPTK